MKWGALVVLLFALILGTMITQAFEFEVIRLLEGYIDLRTRWIQAVVDARIRHYRSKRRRMLVLFQNRKEAAFAEALPALAEKFDPGFIAAVREATTTQDPSTIDVSDDDRADAAAFDWQQFAGSPAVYKLTSLHTLLWDYPAEHRIMPTRLATYSARPRTAWNPPAATWRDSSSAITTGCRRWSVSNIASIGRGSTCTAASR